MPNYNLFEKLKSYGVTATDAQLEELKAAAEKDGANTSGMPDKLDLKLFKKQFLFFANSQGYAKGCTNFITRLEACNTPIQVMHLFKSYNDEFAEALDIDDDDDDDCSSCDDKDEEIKDLEKELQRYEGISYRPPREVGTLLYEMKLRAFLENQHNFSVDDIENFFTKKQKAA